MDHAPDPRLAALDRLLAIAQTDTGQSRCVADFLLSWANARACGGFDLTALSGVAAAIRGDMLAVMHLIADRRQAPTAYGLGDAFDALIRLWRPHLTQAVQ